MKFDPKWSRERRFWRTGIDRDVDDELAFHLAMRAELLEQSGLDPQTARDHALARFGDLRDVREHCLSIDHSRERRMKWSERWSDIERDVRHALRRLAAAPGFASAVLLMFALGIGATTAVYGVLDGIVLRPLTFAEPERLVSLSHTITIGGLTTVDQSDASVLFYQRHATTSFESIGAYRLRDVNLAPDGVGGVAERASTAVVNAEFFTTLRATPLLGRLIRADDDRPGAAPVVVLSGSTWRSRFGADRNVIGRQLRIDGTARTIIGVMPESFQFPNAAVTLWTPLAFDRARTSPGSFNFIGIGRLKPGVTIDAARAELAHYLPTLLDEFPGEIPRAMWEQAHLAPVVQPLRDVIVGDLARLLWILFASVALLLAIVIANVASLFVVRTEARHRDVAIRAALGASRRTLVRQYLIEALLLSGGGAALGVLVARGSLDLLRASKVTADLPRLADVHIDARVLGFTLFVAIASGVLVNVLPMLRMRQISPDMALKESSRTAGAGRERQRMRSALVIAQVAFALVLVASSALMLRSFAHLRSVDPGFDPRGVSTIRMALPQASYRDMQRRLTLYQRVIDAAEALPGVARAALTTWIPLTDDHSDSVVEVEGDPSHAASLPPDHLLARVSPAYFTTMGIAMLRGRTFEPYAPNRSTDEVVISQAFAEHYWPKEDALGKRLRVFPDSTWSTVVGVADNVHVTALDGNADEMLYFPMVAVSASGIGVPSAMSLVVRTSSNPDVVTSSVRRLFRDIDPGIATFDERSLSSRVSDASARTRFIMTTLVVASATALIISMIGLYSVLAYGVTLRQREIGLRLAVGATAKDVVQMIARRGVALASIGVTLGLAGAIGVTRSLAHLLFGVSPTDPLTLGATCLLLLVIAWIASWIPARRAAGIAPMEALRRD